MTHAIPCCLPRRRPRRPEWRAQVEPAGPAVAAYTAHLRRLAQERPALLLAHSYTQHLACLLGGSLVGRAARRGMDLPEGAGTASFAYAQPMASLKTAYLEAFDALEKHLSEEEVQEVRRRSRARAAPAGRPCVRACSCCALLSIGLSVKTHTQHRALLQLIAEHLEAFRLNNDILRAFRLGYLAPLRAVLKLAPAKVVWGAAAAAAAALAALAAWRLGGRGWLPGL